MTNFCLFEANEDLLITSVKFCDVFIYKLHSIQVYENSANGSEKHTLGEPNGNYFESVGEGGKVSSIRFFLVKSLILK